MLAFIFGRERDNTIVDCQLPIADLQTPGVAVSNLQLAIGNWQLVEPTNRTPRQIHPNALHLRVEFECLPSHFSPVT